MQYPRFMARNNLAHYKNNYKRVTGWESASIFAAMIIPELILLLQRFVEMIITLKKLPGFGAKRIIQFPISR